MKDIILFIDELHMLVGAGAAEGSMDASNMLKPMLARGELHCVGATTTTEYRKYIEKDAALARRFQPVLVNEPTPEDTISILRGLKEKYEVHHGITIQDASLVAAARMADRYITDRFLPDKAIDLMDEAASRLRMQQESKPENIENIDREIITLKMEVEGMLGTLCCHSHHNSLTHTHTLSLSPHCLSWLSLYMMSMVPSLYFSLSVCVCLCVCPPLFSLCPSLSSLSLPTSLSLVLLVFLFA